MRRDTHLHAGNCTEFLVNPSVELNVGEALDASFARPRPLCAPFHGVALDGFERRTLPTSGCTRRAPMIGQ